jgi:hypothetical protein
MPLARQGCRRNGAPPTLLQNRIEHGIHPMQNIAIRETNNMISPVVQPFGPGQVILHPINVRITVNLNHQAGSSAAKNPR